MKKALCIAMALLAIPLCAMNENNDNDIEMGNIQSTHSESDATHPGESYSANNRYERDSNPALIPRDEHVPRHRHHYYHPDEDFFKSVKDNHEKIAHRLERVNDSLCLGRFSSGLVRAFGAAAIVAMLCGVGSGISSAISNVGNSLSSNIVNSINNIHPQCSCSCPACPSLPPAPTAMTMAYNNVTQFMATAAKMKKEKTD